MVRVATGCRAAAGKAGDLAAAEVAARHNLLFYNTFILLLQKDLSDLIWETPSYNLICAEFFRIKKSG